MARCNTRNIKVREVQKGLTILARLLENIRRWWTSARVNVRIRRYLVSGHKPWTLGYKEYKEMVLRDVLSDQDLLYRFLYNRVLPVNHGFRIDE